MPASPARHSASPAPSPPAQPEGLEDKPTPNISWSGQMRTSPLVLERRKYPRWITSEWTVVPEPLQVVPWGQGSHKSLVVFSA